MLEAVHYSLSFKWMNKLIKRNLSEFKSLQVHAVKVDSMATWNCCQSNKKITNSHIAKTSA